MGYCNTPDLARSETALMAFSESPEFEAQHRISFGNHASRFERLAETATKLPRWPASLDILLGAVTPSSWGGREALWPLWADEAMHRAHWMMILTLRLERCIKQQANRAAWSAYWTERAIALADTLAELRIVDDLEVLPCSGLLGETVAGLLSLFNLPDRAFDARIALEDIAMAAYKRRALVLATMTLVVQTMANAFDRDHTPVIAIKLSAQGRGIWRLAVATEGATPADKNSVEADDIVDGLADLLEAQFPRRLRRLSGFVTEIDFPGPN
jgi:hypothetical protein